MTVGRKCARQSWAVSVLESQYLWSRSRPRHAKNSARFDFMAVCRKKRRSQILGKKITKFCTKFPRNRRRRTKFHAHMMRSRMCPSNVFANILWITEILKPNLACFEAKNYWNLGHDSISGLGILVLLVPRFALYSSRRRLNSVDKYGSLRLPFIKLQKM